MKRILIVVTAMAATLLLNSLYAAEYEPWNDPIYDTQQKDECLLIAKNCPDDMLSVQHRINVLNTEIAKGTDVYTVDELNVLRTWLDNAYKTLEIMQHEEY